MKLLLFHPRLIQRTCARCRAWMYDDEHRIRWHAGRPLARPSLSPTPCWQCPKQNPDDGAAAERDLPRARRMLRLYFAVRATHGRVLDVWAAADPLVCRNLTIVAAIVRQWEESTATVASRL